MAPGFSHVMRAFEDESDWHLVRRGVNAKFGARPPAEYGHT